MTRAHALSRRTVMLSLLIVFAVAYLWFSARMFQATRLASSLDVPSLERAVALEPQQAAYRDLLCRFQLFDKQDPAAALPSCKRATELNPYHSTYLMDLALAYFSVGEEHRQREAILRAVSVDPTTPDVAWTAANFFLTQGEIPQALQQFAVAMRGNVNLVQPSLDLCWRTTHDVNAIQAILPPTPSAYLQFVRLLLAKNQWDAAHQIWSAMFLLNQGVDARRALFYVDVLLDRRDVARAEEAWTQLSAGSAAGNRYSRSDDLIVNGGFENEILNAGFDWRYSPAAGSAAALDLGEFHNGSQSLVITYKGSSSDSGVSQYVPVKPNSNYTVSAWVKGEKLEGANGPFVAIVDAYDGKVYGKTVETLGTTSWRHVETSFQTGPQSQLVAIRFTRDPAGTVLRGKFWVDDVTLHESREPSHAAE